MILHSPVVDYSLISYALISFLSSKGAVAASPRDGGVMSVFKIIPSFSSICSQGKGLLMCSKTLYQGVFVCKLLFLLFVITLLQTTCSQTNYFTALLSEFLLFPGGYENENNASLYVVLPIVISTSVLLLGALLVSHQR